MARANHMETAPVTAAMLSTTSILTRPRASGLGAATGRGAFLTASGVTGQVASRRPSQVIASIILAMLSVTASVSAAPDESSLLPYTPTTILIPGSTTGSSEGQDLDDDANTTAFIFTPSNSKGSVEFLSLDISTSLYSSSVSNAANTLTSVLPFLSSSSNTTTFTPTLALDGSIIVYAGDCASTNSSGVWIYNTTSSVQQSSWVQHQTSSSTFGPYFLGGAIAFSETIWPTLSSADIYYYGGQCPNSTLGGTNWVNAADYTNSMLKLPPSSDSYRTETLSLKSQPIAEAGFSFSALRASTSNISGTVTQSINSVILGGHTRNAFVNMSTAAVWSLPEESWSFISISGPSTSSLSDSSELAKHDGTTQVQSRSGHTAVLNEAGTALVVLGGWVGNTSIAADPQLAMLEMNGKGFGEWTWTVPDNQPLTGGEGIYGHGAALLPGNVMMVAGGRSISSTGSPNSQRRRRNDIEVAGGQLQMFLNLTSMSWSDSYTNPSTKSPGSNGSTASSSASTKLGLGLGLGLGIPLFLILLALGFFCVRRRQRHKHAIRDQQVRSLASGTAFITSEEMLERQHEHEYPWGPRGATRWYYTGGHDPYLREDESVGFESLRGSEDIYDSSDATSSETMAAYRTSARRKPAPRVAKCLYQPTGVDDNRALGAIHPILEDEEDEISLRGAMSPDKDMEGEDDPFITPSPSPTKDPETLGQERNTILFVEHSSSPGPSSPIDVRTHYQPPQHPEVQDWVTDIDASDALITARIQPHSTTLRNSGKLSPSRRPSVRRSEDDGGGGARTESNLSESNRSAFSFVPNRSDSLRMTPAAAGQLGVSNTEYRGGTSHSDNSSSSNSNTSFTTAKSIPTLRAEAPRLLLGRPRAISDIEDITHNSDDDLTPGSPSKSKPPRRSWFGSLKRVFSGGHSSSSSNGGSIRTESPAQGESGDYDRFGLNSLGLGGVGLLQKRRQGRSAWDERGAPGSGHREGVGEGWEEDEWDIEKAVEQRLVQVMFSVPKDRLRVVNGDPDIVSLGESAVVVDPGQDNDRAAGGDGGGGRVGEEEAGLRSIEEEERRGWKGKAKIEGESSLVDKNVAVSSALVEGHNKAEREDADEEKQTWRKSLLLELPPRAESVGSESPGRRSVSPGVPMTAEEIRFERPRTRVQAMVESFEERSRSSSPVRKG